MFPQSDHKTFLHNVLSYPSLILQICVCVFFLKIFQFFIKLLIFSETIFSKTKIFLLLNQRFFYSYKKIQFFLPLIFKVQSILIYIEINERFGSYPRSCVPVISVDKNSFLLHKTAVYLVEKYIIENQCILF